MDSIELFAGAGGLGIGVSKAGFRHASVLEFDEAACATIESNRRTNSRWLRGWPKVEPSDVREFDFSDFSDVTLLSGGPPCQPFSLGGKHRGFEDHRDMFPEVARAQRETTPQAIIIENVRGLTRPKFASYFDYILLQLSLPEVKPIPGEAWEEHLLRLRMERDGAKYEGLRYDVRAKVLNAADYGVPQRRERVFIVGFRKDLGIHWNFPAPTHSLDRLLYDQWISSDYWDRVDMPKSKRPRSAPLRFERRIQSLGNQLISPPEQAWRTVREALIGLPEPGTNSDTHLNHIYIPGARVYPGHTGSPLDEPAKTLKAGDHGVPGGENMMVGDDNAVRYFSVREAARLQTFPDDYSFPDVWTSAMRQLGNAVPVELAEIVAKQVRRNLAQVGVKEERLEYA